MRLAFALLFFLPLAAHAAPRWDFHATLDAASESLTVQACSDVAQPEVRFHAAAGASANLDTFSRSAGNGLREDGDGLIATDWQRGECLVTRVDLAAASRGGRNRFGYRRGDYIVLAPERWLWRPMRVDPASEIRFTLPDGWQVSVPWRSTVEGRYRLGPTDADWPALTAFGRFDVHSIEFAGGGLRVAILPPWSVARDLERIVPVAQALASAYGRMPRREAQILVVPIPGSKEAAPWGQATRGGGSAVHLLVGADAPREALIADWTATHEFSHLLHPYFGSRGRWLGEGLASYYQNVLRARVGELTPEQAWDKLEAGFDRGRRETKSTGMTLEETARSMGSTHAFMRVYWSGAAFWLESDLALRAHGSSIDIALRDYAECCFGDDPAESPIDFMTGLDRVAPQGGFVARFRRYASLREFPATPSRRDPAIMRKP